MVDTLSTNAKGFDEHSIPSAVENTVPADYLKDHTPILVIRSEEHTSELQSLV